MTARTRVLAAQLVCATSIWLIAAHGRAARHDGVLTINAADEQTGKPLAVRLELRNARGRVVRTRPKGATVLSDGVYFAGSIQLQLRRGAYRFLIEAGPEFRTRPGTFTIDRRSEGTETVTLLRRVDMAAENWIAGDLDAQIPTTKLDLPQRALGVSVVDDGKNLATSPASAWDLPMLAAHGRLEAVMLIDRHSTVDGNAQRGDGYPRDVRQFPDPLGDGRWSETIYHHLLNCGLKIPPVAGSGAGENRNPLGANRVYVHADDPDDQELWWQRLRQGRVFVTNGPLLRTQVERQPPGQVFHLSDGETRTFQIALDLAFYEQTQVAYLEIVKDGKVLHEIRLDELARQKGKLPPVVFDQSGWFLVRAVTDNAKRYQFASTGPYYVDGSAGPLIRRKSVEFFLDWLDAAAEHFSDAADRRAQIETARPFWQSLLRKSR